MNESGASQSLQVHRCRSDGTVERVRDRVSTEGPLEIRIRGRSVAITMRTPGHDRELAAGFAISEGLLAAREDLVDIAHCRQEEASHPENIINIYLPGHAACDLEGLTRHVFASSSCGICGKASLEALHNHWPPLRSRFRISPRELLRLPSRLREVQREFRRTGGLHAAALFDREGSLVCIREDVGRHNAVDKAIGRAFLERNFPLEDHLLLVSGRASFEILQKALAARIPFVAAISAPSSLAVEAARENGQTLVGFLREESFSVYSRPEGIADHLD